MLAYNIQTSGNCPEESIQHSEHGKSLKSRITKTIIHAYDILYRFSVACLKQNKNMSKVDNVANNTTKGVVELCSMV
jgi:hypothetical protein